QQLKVAGQRARLATELVARDACHAVKGAGPRFEDDAEPCQRHPHWRQHVVENRFGWQGPPQRAPKRVDGPGDAEHRGDRALLTAQPLLVLPIEADTVAHRRVLAVDFAVENELARDATDIRRSKWRDQRTKGVRRERLTG